jgi:hypothetical protein
MSTSRPPLAPPDAFEGTMQFYVSFRIDPREMATWPPERIKLFFGGIAKMLEAANHHGDKDEGR